VPASPRQNLQALMRTGGALLMLPLSGCVALVISSADYEAIDVTLHTQEQVVAALGEPARRTGSAGAQTWYYQLTDVGLAGQPVRETLSAGALVVVPAWSRTNYVDNVKFEFAGDKLVAAHERFERRSGGGCGLFVGHGVHGLCGTEDTKSPATIAHPATKTPYDAPSTTTEFDIRQLPLDCEKHAWKPSDAACLAARLIRGRAPAATALTLRVHDWRDYFLVLPGAGAVAGDLGYPEIRVAKHAGVAAAWRQPDSASANRQAPAVP